jgi:biofilm PGA synthesis lipoprotein PgaB
MRPLAALVAIVLALWSAAAAAAEWPQDSFVVLCYHEIRDDARQRPDSYTLETGQLVLQFEWLRSQGYHVVRLDDVIAARAGVRPLPPRAVLITFDDGLESVYSRAFPLLQAFGYPAVVALVGGWLEEGNGTRAAPRYGDVTLSRADFLRQTEIDAMRRSGLIEFASHTYDLHVGIVANPQGNLEPAAVARRYDPVSGAYEDAAAHAARIAADLAAGSERIAALTGARPRLVAWPYGAHDRVTDAIAGSLGMPYGMSLELGINTPDIPLTRMRRILVTHDYTTADLARVLEAPLRRAPLRALTIDLDRIQDADPQRQEANLSRLLDAVQASGANSVFLRAWSGGEAAGTLPSVYFPNRRLPLRADLFNRAAWQLRTRLGVAVYASLPPQIGGSPEAAQDIFDDLSAAATFQGLLFAAAPGAASDSGATAALAARVGADHDGLLTARALAAGDVAAALPAALTAADFVTVPAAGSGQVAQVGLLPQGLAKTVFQVAEGARAAAQLDALRRAGARNLALGAGAVARPEPASQALRRALSLQSFPGDN